MNERDDNVIGLILIAIFGVFGSNACIGYAHEENRPADQKLGHAAEKTEIVQVGGPGNPPCEIGNRHPDAQTVPLQDVLQNPDLYAGHLVSVRGYFVLQFENISLVEPQTRKGAVLVGTKWLHVKDFAKAQACHLKLVDVEGYSARIPARGGERVLLQAYSIRDAREP